MKSPGDRRGLGVPHGSPSVISSGRLLRATDGVIESHFRPHFPSNDTHKTLCPLRARPLPSQSARTTETLALPFSFLTPSRGDPRGARTARLGGRLARTKIIRHKERRLRVQARVSGKRAHSNGSRSQSANRCCTRSSAVLR